MRDLIRDARFAVRLWRGTPVVFAVSALSIALGVGSTSVIFALVDALLLRPLQASRPSELVRVGLTRNGEGFYGLSHAEYLAVRGLDGIFEGVVAHQPTDYTLRGDGEPRRVWGEIVSGNYFDVLGIAPAIGRSFRPEEDRTPGTHAVAVIGDGLWRRQFAADPSIAGKAVRVNGRPFTVVGVAPAGYRGAFPGFTIDLWLPVMMHDSLNPGRQSLASADDRFLMAVGRLRRGVSTARARAALDVLAKSLDPARPAAARNAGFAVVAATGVHPFVASLVKAFLAVLTAIVWLVLIIACVNVSGLLLARGTARRAEMAARLALGASRRRLIRQMLVESVLLGLLGGSGGIVIALAGVRALSAFRPTGTAPIGLALALDARVLMFALSVSLLTGIVFGLLPALQASQLQPIGALKGDAGDTGSGRRVSRIRATLLVGQIAISTLLLIAAGLLLRSLLSSRMIDPGFDATSVATVSLSPDSVGYDRARSLAMFDRLVTETESLPGVRKASLALFAPLGDRGDQLRVRAEGAATADVRTLGYNLLWPGFFEVLRIPMLHGRDFNGHDRDGSPAVAIVNAAFAAREWPGLNPLGRRVIVVERDGRERVHEVIGVVRDAKLRSLGEEGVPYFFLALRQHSRLDAVLLVRTDGDPRALLPPLRAKLHESDPEVPFEAERLQDVMGFSAIPVRVAATVAGICGVIALLLAVIGLYGVASFETTQRMREMAIRMAIGADTATLMRLLVGRTLVLTGVGVTIGAAVAWGAVRVISMLLYGVGPHDPLTFVVVPTLLVGVAGVASLLPARVLWSAAPLMLLRRD